MGRGTLPSNPPNLTTLPPYDLITLPLNQTGDETIEEMDCHQPLKGVGLLVKREPVPLKREEEIWLREEWGLRACYT